jgi:hypothetical protein
VPSNGIIAFSARYGCANRCNAWALGRGGIAAGARPIAAVARSAGWRGRADQSALPRCLTFVYRGQAKGKVSQFVQLRFVQP